jgi:glycerate 2-kinase
MAPAQDPVCCLRALFDAAVGAARPTFGPDEFEGLDPTAPALVLGAGKAAAAMAQAFEAAWSGPVRGLVITRRGYSLPTRHIEVVEGDHPAPSEDNIRATDRLIALARSRQANEQAVFLVSGGGSALLCKPKEGLSLAEKRATAAALMDAGADIREINTVRRQLSMVKGGGIARLLAPARVATFAISDVVGDPPLDIASGPTVADRGTPRDALLVLRRYSIPLSATLKRLLDRDPPAHTTALPADNSYKFLGTPMASLRAAANAAEEVGLHPVILGDDITGEAREVGAAHARLALEHARAERGTKRPLVLLSGGELTVTKTGAGKGGPNTEYLAALFHHLQGHAGISALAADTDGIDGSEDNAGAIVTPGAWQRARMHGLDATGFLVDNDCYSFFKALDALLVTGPTYTNVNDFRAILIE